MKKDSKPEKRDDGLFGIDWDGDGKVGLFDDFLTMDLFEDVSGGGSGGKSGGCMLFLVTLPVQVVFALLKGKGML